MNYVVRQHETNKENNSLLNRMLELEAKPPNNYTNIIPENVPTNPRTHKLLKEYERTIEQVNINHENRVVCICHLENTQTHRISLLAVRSAEVAARLEEQPQLPQQYNPEGIRAGLCRTCSQPFFETKDCCHQLQLGSGRLK